MTRPASTRGLVYTTSTFSESTIAGKDTCFIPKSQNRSKQQDRDELRLAPYRVCLGGKDTGTVICWGRGSFDRGDLKEVAGATVRAMEPQA